MLYATQTFVDLHSRGANHAPAFRNRCPCDNDRCFSDVRFSWGRSSTLPQKISDQTDLIGTTISADGKVKAFIYKLLSKSSAPPFAPPFDTGNVTQGRGINNKRHSCGDYLNGSDGTFHGYLMFTQLYNDFRSNPPTATPTSDLPLRMTPQATALSLIFTPFDLTAALDTIPLGINNFGDLVGYRHFQ